MYNRRGHFSMSNSYPENTSRISYVRDCQLWAEIDYLDSPTDYREYLCGQEISPDTSDRSELVMLETQKYCSRRSKRRVFALVVGVIAMLSFLLICGCFFHLFLDTF